MDVSEGKRDIIVKAEIPGVDKERHCQQRGDHHDQGKETRPSQDVLMRSQPRDDQGKEVRHVYQSRIMLKIQQLDPEIGSCEIDMEGASFRWLELPDNRISVFTSDRISIIGFYNKEISEMLHISVKTVEKHRANNMNKPDLHNDAALTAYAIEHGLAMKKG